MQQPTPSEIREAERDALSHELPSLFPEVCGEPVDPERHDASVLLRALNDGRPELRERIIAYYGEARSAELALSSLNQLTNPAFRRFQVRFQLPDRDPAVTFTQGLWMK